VDPHIRGLTYTRTYRPSACTCTIVYIIGLARYFVAPSFVSPYYLFIHYGTTFIIYIRYIRTRIYTPALATILIPSSSDPLLGKIT
jgi:hypothetical protein